MERTIERDQHVQQQIARARQLLNSAILALAYGKNLDGLEMLDEAIQALEAAAETLDLT